MTIPLRSALPLLPPYTPELLPRVRRFLEYHILGADGDPNVLELGAGYSTVWFSRLGCKVISLEHSKDWAEAVEPLCHATVLLREPKDFVGEIKKLNPIVQVLYVDCVDEQRLPCLRAALPKLVENAVVILDDSHWEMLLPAFDLLKDFSEQVTFKGIHTRKTGEIKFHQTTIYFKGDGL